MSFPLKLRSCEYLSEVDSLFNVHTFRVAVNFCVLRSKG